MRPGEGDMKSSAHGGLESRPLPPGPLLPGPTPSAGLWDARGSRPPLTRGPLCPVRPTGSSGVPRGLCEHQLLLAPCESSPGAAGGAGRVPC